MLLYNLIVMKLCYIYFINIIKKVFVSLNFSLKIQFLHLQIPHLFSDFLTYFPHCKPKTWSIGLVGSM